MDVCVVGAGPAGIVAAKVLLQNGFDVTVFDKNARVGGIWAPGGNYDGLSNQASLRLFEFSDLPSGLHYGSAVDSQRYLERYAATFGVLRRVRFETEVTTVRAVDSAERLGAGGWVVGFRPAGSTATQQETFDHVVVASGAHHHPHVPDLPGRDAFPGTVLHSNDVRAGVFDGRRVVVVGGGKSALDLVLRAARVGSSATLVQRKVNWMVPQRLLLGTVGYKWILMTRLGEALLPHYDNEACVRVLDRMSERVKRVLWQVVARDMLISSGLHRLPKDLRPAHPLPHHLAHAGVMPRGYARAVRRGLVSARLGTVTAFTGTGVRLATDEELPADVVVLATGHRRVFPFLDPRVRTHDDAGRVRLFRGIVAPGADRLAFSGFRQIFNNILGVELTAHWIAAHFRGSLRVAPDEDAVDARLAWQERVLPGSGGYDLGPYDIHSADELMHDMGLPSRRAGNPFAEHLLPGGVARRYTGLRTP
ncbi:flavin-containing monooxygenase [Actinophytocola algeriensis]|uniref:Cation diffusion facilitator CzcD-associated flavoprotein CzcO n=1 Tax=Actinophytocola algeriensis TaxID=1768010 RepID=A0A7W7QG38_9PSEU|nr:NAD(P)/FAD-dependent oxidoreductase [Actinophytocola algeriensis]MBB4912894.1 cation diffusion facilitator CzcD-associated flavoprotein CzcO [Actinophytocola algeriensis]MBE1474091.1 cation diffusion facilitator CzcD-associated flavoprotein CzcO [Actinophytocola algeriensis]